MPSRNCNNEMKVINQTNKHANFRVTDFRTVVVKKKSAQKPYLTLNFNSLHKILFGIWDGMGIKIRCYELHPLTTALPPVPIYTPGWSGEM